MESMVSREIMWNIPYWMKTSMYVLLIPSLAYMVLGLYKKYQFVIGNGGLKDLLPNKLNWGAFFKTSFLTGKVPRSSEVKVFHGLIFYGFLILWIATDLVAIHYDTPLKVFQGPLYIVVSFLADFAGLAILAGIALAYHRRYIKKPDYLESTKPKQELFMYSMLIALVLLGYALEGLRIEGTRIAQMSDPTVIFNTNEQFWSPVGWILASILHATNISAESLSLVWRSAWFVHMINTMVFVACLGHSKFSHIFILPFSALVTPKRRGGVLSPMDFENEEAETFGLGKLSEMTAKNKLDMLACVECGRCTQVCPANNAGKPLDPKKIITKPRDFAFSLAEKGESDGEFWGESQLFQSNELDSCTTCGACMEECPANIEHVSIIMEAKRYKTLTLGEIPPAAADAANKIEVNGNPWGIAQDDRFNWAEGLDIPLITPEKKVDYLYYVGCAGSYDAANQKVVKDTVMLLKEAGVDFALIGKTEKCNGDPIRRFGNEYAFFEIAIQNITAFNEYQFDKIVTHCPHCLHTIGKEYAQFENGEFEVVHHTELLNDLLKNGKLRPKKNIDQELTFHDPCYLGRHHGEYNAPREILNSIPGLSIKEMEKNKEKALCCGMGGGNMWYELPEGEHLAKKRLEDVAETKTSQMATACSFCLINFNSSKAQVKETEEIEIEDVACLLAKSIL